MSKITFSESKPFTVTAASKQVDYLRISLIDRCNFRCQYCMPEGSELQYLMRQDWLSDDELLTLIQEVFPSVSLTKGPGTVPLIATDGRSLHAMVWLVMWARRMISG